jgi:hypothetical protein
MPFAIKEKAIHAFFDGLLQKYRQSPPADSCQTITDIKVSRNPT